MSKPIAVALVGTLILAALPAAPAVAANPATCASGAQTADAAKPKKKRGFGFGSILKAANQAGVGNMLGYGGMLGNGQMGQVAGAIAGTAVNAASGSADPQGAAGHIGGLMGGSRAGQIAGAVTGTAAHLARTGPRSGESAGQAAAPCGAAVVEAYQVGGKSASLQPMKRLHARVDRSAPARDGKVEVWVTFRNPGKDLEAVNPAAQRLMGPNASGSFVSARHALYAAAGERTDGQTLPLPYMLGPGREIQVRYVFEDAPTGELTITDGTASHVFTPASR